VTAPRIYLSHGTLDAGPVFHGRGLPTGVVSTPAEPVGWCPCIGRSRRAPNLTEPEKVWPDRPDAAWAPWLTDGVSPYHDGLVMLDQEGARADELWADDDVTRNVRVQAFVRQMNRVQRSLAARVRTGWYGMPGRFWFAVNTYDADWVRNLRIGDVYRAQDVCMPSVYHVSTTVGDGELGYVDHVMTVAATIARRYQRRLAPVISFRLFGNVDGAGSIVLPDEMLVAYWRRVLRFQPDDVILWSNESRWGFEAQRMREELGRKLTPEEEEALEAEGVARLNRMLALLRGCL